MDSHLLHPWSARTFWARDEKDNTEQCRLGRHPEWLQRLPSMKPFLVYELSQGRRNNLLVPALRSSQTQFYCHGPLTLLQSPLHLNVSLFLFFCTEKPFCYEINTPRRHIRHSFRTNYKSHNKQLPVWVGSQCSSLCCAVSHPPSEFIMSAFLCSSTSARFWPELCRTTHCGCVYDTERL